MKNRLLVLAQPNGWKGLARSTASITLLLGVAMLNAACSTADPLTDPPLSAAQPDVNAESPFSPISSADENPVSTPSTPPPQIDNIEAEPLEIIEPAQSVDEPDIEPVSPATPEQTVVSRATCTASESDMQQRMLQLINEARATERSCGLDNYSATQPLSWNTVLASAARGHSEDMATHNFFSHTGSDGRSASARVTDAGYRWRTVGENIAAGRDTAADTVDDWLNSPGHCRNIMNPSFTEVAVTCVEDSGADYRRYWTNVLAAPR